MGQSPVQQFAQFPYGLLGLFGGARLYLIPSLGQLAAYNIGKRLNHPIRFAGDRMGCRIDLL